MKSGFDYKEYKTWCDNVKIVEKDFRNWLERFLLNQAYRVMAKGKPRTPVDTGALVNSWYVGDITWVGRGLQVEIGLSQEYASFQEFGTRFFDGKYMLTISLDEIQRELPARFNDEWFRFLKRNGVV